MLRNGWGWLIEQRKRMARAVSGYFWSSFVGIPGSGRSDVWWALDRPGVSFLTKIKYLYYCLYLYIVHVLLYFDSISVHCEDWIGTELRLNWRLNFAVPLSQHSTNCCPAPISKSFQEFAFSLLARRGFWRLFFSSQGRILEMEQKNFRSRGRWAFPLQSSSLVQFRL